jgi:hypothetical protein
VAVSGGGQTLQRSVEVARTTASGARARGEGALLAPASLPRSSPYDHLGAARAPHGRRVAARAAFLPVPHAAAFVCCRRAVLLHRLAAAAALLHRAWPAAVPHAARPAAHASASVRLGRARRRLGRGPVALEALEVDGDELRGAVVAVLDEVHAAGVRGGGGGVGAGVGVGVGEWGWGGGVGVGVGEWG